MAPGEPIELEEARETILAAAKPVGREPAELTAAQGRVLAEAVVASEPVPPFDGSAMDGYAVRSADVAGASRGTPTILRVVGESRAGAPAAVPVAAGQAVAVSTGAVIPDGADSVARVEVTRSAGDTVAVHEPVAAGEDVRRAGEDVRPGHRLLEPGAVLGPAELGVLASLGRTRVACSRRPRLSLLVTGDELLRPGDPGRAGAIHDSNSHTVAALARAAGAAVTSVSSARDDAARTGEAVAAALAGVDVAVICGGVSVGAHDHVRPALRRLGVREHFWGVALKPGRPTWFGTHGRTLVFGLPGNPVSAMVTFVLLVEPALRVLLSRPAIRARASARMACDYRKRPGRAHALRCRLTLHDDGLRATPTGPQGSHVLTSMLGADALAIVPSHVTALAAGERVQLEPLRAWVGA